jgi:hypothetical protein
VLTDLMKSGLSAHVQAGDLVYTGVVQHRSTG